MYVRTTRINSGNGGTLRVQAVSFQAGSRIETRCHVKNREVIRIAYGQSRFRDYNRDASPVTSLIMETAVLLHPEILGSWVGKRNSCCCSHIATEVAASDVDPFEITPNGETVYVRSKF